MEKGYDFWLCHTTKKVSGLKIVVDCHTRRGLAHCDFF
jgi:hypothetical protein